MIKVENVTHHFNASRVLNKVNLEVQTGELLALMGPNGMGKSTLLSIIAGLLAPFKGSVSINGVERRSNAANELQLRRETFYLPDKIWTPFQQSGREYLLMVGKVYGLDEIEVYDHADKLLKLYELDKIADFACTSYSCGQFKKLSLCSALISQAKLLILDEPFSGGLDSSGLHYTKQILKTLADNEDVTVLMAVPVPELVEGLADRIAIIKEGEILSCDTLENLKRRENCSGTLAELLERMIHPEGIDRMKCYLET